MPRGLARVEPWAWKPGDGRVPLDGATPGAPPGMIAEGANRPSIGSNAGRRRRSLRLLMFAPFHWVR